MFNYGFYYNGGVSYRGNNGTTPAYGSSIGHNDILMIAFVKSLIDELDFEYLKILDTFVNMDDETLISFKRKEVLINFKDKKMLDIVNRFQNFS